MIDRALPAAWAAVLLYVLARYATAQMPPVLWVYGLAASSFAWLLLRAREDAAAMLRSQPLLFDGAIVLAALAFAAQLLAAPGAVQPYERVLPQPALLLCLPALALVLRREPALQSALGVLACAAAAWHLVALPMEAATGLRLGWHQDALPARDAGPLHYQAAGLAQQTYFFAGLYLPLFYVGWGWAWEKATGERRGLRVLLLVALAAWVAAVACVQSRSALVGAALASGLLAVGALPPRARRLAPWIVAGGVMVLGAVYLLLFSQNKSGPGLRWAYAQLYLHATFDGLRLFTGHGLTATPPESMRLAEYPISHSHNDLVQVLYSWGLPALLAYACFLFGLVRLACRRFVADGALWPAAALLALLPNVVTDLGVQHYEKAAFLVLLAALCAAQAGRPKPLRP